MDTTDQDIYGKDFYERNAIVALPENYVKDAGNTLYSWLGSLWHTIHRGDNMVRGLQQARGIRLAQLYLNLLEAAKLQDRNGAPVFHKELWHPIVLRLSQRNKAQENMLVMGEGAQMGPQTEKDPYGIGTVLEMGKLANYADYVTYSISENIVGMSSVIVDNIINPTVSMEHDKNDFLFRNNSIIFPKANDPLASDSPFDKCDLPDLILKDPDDPNSPMVSDVEVVLWASDVLIDKNYIAEHLSYPLGANAPSTDVVKRIINAAWSSVASGLTPELIRTFIAAMLNIPVIQYDQETVVDINSSSNAQVVYTDKGMYRVSPRARLRKGLHAGSVLVKGDLLDESLRVYPFLNGVNWSFGGQAKLAMDGMVESFARFDDIISEGRRLFANVSSDCFPSKRASTSSGSSGSSSSGSSSSSTPPELIVTYKDTGFSVPLEQDIPSIVLSRDILRVRTKYGVYAMWGATEVKASKNDPSRLYFDIFGTDDDKAAFWNDVWKHADAAGVSMAKLIGNEGDQVSPAAFFLRHFVGANTLFVVVDDAQLEDDSLLRDPMFFGMLSSVVPSAIRLFIVEHRGVADDRMNLGSMQEGTFLSAALPEVREYVAEVGIPGQKVAGASFQDTVAMRFVRAAPAKVRVRKEEA